jgi:hypothetical protein
MTAEELLAASRRGPKDHLRAMSLSLELAGAEERRRFIWLFRTGLLPPGERRPRPPEYPDCLRKGDPGYDDMCRGIRDTPWEDIRRADTSAWRAGHRRAGREPGGETDPGSEAALRAWEDSEDGALDS